MNRALSLLLLLSFSLAPAPITPALAADSPRERGNLSRYAKYRFGDRAAKVVDLANQPLAAPIGVVGTVLGHDRLLRTALAERGWVLRSHSFLQGVDVNFYFQRGELEVALAGDWPTITLAANQEIQVVGLAKQGFSSLIAKGQHRVADLKGKRIGSAAGSTAHYGLLVALDNAGLTEAEVTIVPVAINEMSAALSAGRVDAFAAWEPVAANALRNHPEFSVVQRFMNNSYLYCAADWAVQNPEIADLVTAAFVRSLRWLREDRSNLLRAVGWTQRAEEELVGAPSTQEAEVLARITTDDLLAIAATPAIPAQDLAEHGSVQRAFTFLQRHGKITATVPWQKIERSFAHTAIDRVLADPGKFKLLAFDYDE